MNGTAGNLVDLSTDLKQENLYGGEQLFYRPDFFAHNTKFEITLLL